jgi:RIO-like serine/threonine protein kinase
MHNKEQYLQELDSLIMHQIVQDIINGTLLLNADTETLDMMLTNIWEMRESYERAGVIIGDA